ncbi:MAG: D-aminoacyl-tRNA deacylase [Deltaproteobacteria bacterium]|mgnify:CR=1 FL=1|jgi:D-tyrosyl-tRNA(Tyr) deacylase|nr:MAG: D-aminoacyl-tRNA deacylase [Deltaproteobacteria bacterium]
MRAVIQRVKEARVEVNGDVVGRIGKGVVVFIGIGKDDTEADIKYMVDKVTGLRIFENETGKMNLSVKEIGGEILVISQFTLYGDCRRGRRPSFDKAAPFDRAEALYNLFIQEIRRSGLKAEAGIFRTVMDVFIVNSGPVTLLLDSKKVF